MKKSFLRLTAAAAVLACAPAFAQLDAAVQRAAAAQKQPLLDTLKELVDIETGSKDIEGINRATEVLAAKLRALGAQVEFIQPTDATTYRMRPTRATSRACS